MSEDGLRKTHQLIAVNARFFLQSVIGADQNLSAQAVVFAPDKARPASPKLLVFQRIQRLTVQAVRVAIDDLDISTVTLFSFEASKVGHRGPLDERGAVLVNAIQSAEKLLWKCDRCLDSHKIIILPYAGQTGRDKDPGPWW